MQNLFYIMVVGELLFGFWSLWGGLQWLAKARRGLLRHPGFFSPRVALLCPCKGMEHGLEENLTSMTEQDYPNFEIFFVMARSDDPASKTVRRVVEASGAPAHIVIAGKPEACGEKVNNLRVAVEQLDPSFDVFVFADSDGRPGRQWLAHLVAPLSNVNLGAATTFRWWLPNRGGFWSAFGAAWDSSIATLQGQPGRTFCWGGGTAIRRSMFEHAAVAQHWTGAVSDDWAMTRALRMAGKPIEFVPECLVPTLRDAGLKDLLEFTNRQLTITRVYAPGMWAAAAFAHLIYCATFILGGVLIVQAWMDNQLWLETLVILWLILLLAAAKGVLRWLAALDLLPAWRHKLETYAWAWTILSPLVPILYALNFMVSAVSRNIHWRGVRYRIVSAGQKRNR